MTITYHNEFEQGSGDWTARRCGMLTASEMELIITPTLKVANNEKQRSHLYELLAQRNSGYVEPQYVSDAMLRGENEEITARELYSEKYALATECAFVTNDKWGFHIGFSPDGLIGDDGLIEIKSRRQKFQAQTIIEGILPPEFSLQIQTGLLVSERKWCDFISYSGGMPVFVLRVEPDPTVQKAIVEAATAFEWQLRDKFVTYQQQASRLIPTERKDYEEIIL